jgi:hypothetical protein
LEGGSDIYFSETALGISVALRPVWDRETHPLQELDKGAVITIVEPGGTEEDREWSGMRYFGEIL